MQKVCVEAYRFEELDENAKQAAISELTTGDWDYEVVFDDAIEMGKLMGIDIDTYQITTMGGYKRDKPSIFFSGFWSQGDGACYECNYSYRSGSVKAIIEACGDSDKELIRIAKGLQDVQKNYFYKLCAKTKHRGHYYHEYCMDVDVFLDHDPYRQVTTAEKDISELLRDFAKWIYRMLELQYRHCTSEEYVKDMCDANDYLFNKSGELINVHVLQPVQDTTATAGVIL